MSVPCIATVTASTATYALLFRAIATSSQIHAELRTRVKAISAAHSAFTTCIALYLMCFGRWQWNDRDGDMKEQSRQVSTSAKLDDSANPIIAGKNAAANALTAWEAGYLIYDTFALFFETRIKYKTTTTVSTASMLAKRSPIFLAHHIALISALIWLQHYIAAGREKGLWIILAMLAMNASNPLLHLSWWMRRVNGKHSVSVDSALVVVFALSRFANMYWVVQRYGRYHSLGAWEAMSRQRVQCRTGTGLLVGLNAIWWIGLVRKTASSYMANTVK